MSSKENTYPNAVSLLSKDILRRALLVALALGSVLTLTNQSDAVFGSGTLQVLPLVLVYLTPFIVVTVSQILGIRRAARDAQFGRVSYRAGKPFFATAMSHGIPFRSLLLGSIIGTANTSIVVSAALVADGTLSNLPAAMIVQAFTLPMVFGFVSQAISYRRAVAAIGRQPQPAPQTLST